MNKTITAEKAPAAVGPYCHAKLAGDTLYTSGQLGLIPATGELPQGVEAQAAQALDNLKAVLAAAGMGLCVQLMVGRLSILLSGGKLGELVTLGLCALAGAALYFLLALILRVEEAGAVLSLVKKKQ